MKPRRAFLSILVVVATLTPAWGCTERVVKSSTGGLGTQWEQEEKHQDLIVHRDGSTERVPNRAALQQEDPGIIFDPRVAPGSPNQTEKDIDALRARIKEQPQNPEWYFKLGRAYEQRQFLGDAERYYRQGKALCPPGYTGPHFYLGRVLVHQKRFDEALVELQACVAVKPMAPSVLVSNADYREAFYLMGFIYYVKEERSLSEECFRLFIQYGGERGRAAHFFPHLIAE